MTRVERSSIFGLTVLSLVVAGGLMGAAPGTQTAHSVPSTADRVAQMLHHFSDVMVVHDAVIRGDLAAVREPALKLARVVMPGPDAGECRTVRRRDSAVRATRR